MKSIFLASILLLSIPAIAQHHGYAKEQSREIKALSNEEIKQFQSGAGMGFAMPAELNHYPGPMHALELADRLELTPMQRGDLQKLMDAHKAEARVIGARLIEAERDLDALFRSGKVSADDLKVKVEAAGSLRAEYRLSHLDTHRRTRELLTTTQIALYDRLRGYPQDGHKPLR